VEKETDRREKKDEGNDRETAVESPLETGLKAVRIE
jgi:hypothetical protein